MQSFEKSSSIHGVQYVFNKNLSKTVRIFWISILFFSLCGFGFYIRSAYIKWQISPDISLTVRERKPEEFPHPAITICSPVFAKSSLVNFTDIASPLKAEEPPRVHTKAECEYAVANYNWCNIGFKAFIQAIEKECGKLLENIDELNALKLINESGVEPYLSIGSVGRLKQFEIIKPVKIFTHKRGGCYTTNLQDVRSIFSDEVDNDFLKYLGE